MDSLYHTDPTAALEALGRLPHLALEYLGGNHLGWEVVEKDSPDRLAVLRTDTRRAAAPHAPPRLRILAVAGEHAREAITTEVALRLAAAIGANESAAVDWAIMPLVNVGGRRLFWRGDYCRRANERGVDLNRNWPTGSWGQVWEGHRRGEVFEGPEPLSEPETRLVAAFARRWRPHVFLSLHSGQDALLAPHAHTMELPRNHAQQVAALHEVNRRARVVQPERVGAAFTHTGYACAGTSLDWFNDALNVSWSFAFEMGTWPARHAARKLASAADWALAMQQLLAPEESDPQWCRAHFNPTTAPAFEKAVGDWTAAALALRDVVTEEITARQSL